MHEMLIKQTHWEENKRIFSKITLHERSNENKHLSEREEKHLDINLDRSRIHNT